MPVEDPCIPWYFPKNDSDSLRLCNPWEARVYESFMTEMPLQLCDKCLPDCSTTIYSAYSTAAPIKRCDFKNFGISFLCQIDVPFQPALYGQNVVDQYLSDINEVPDVISTLVQSNTRIFADARSSGRQIFEATNKMSPTYDAYKKDIAIVNFFFETNTIFAYERDLKLTLIQYISQIGGLFGLFLGFSLISAFEIIFWFAIKFTRELSIF